HEADHQSVRIATNADLHNVKAAQAGDRCGPAGDRRPEESDGAILVVVRSLAPSGEIPAGGCDRWRRWRLGDHPALGIAERLDGIVGHVFRSKAGNKLARSRIPPQASEFRGLLTRPIVSVPGVRF